MKRTLVFAVILSLIPGLAYANSFTDDDRSIHEQAIEAIATEGITRGCSLDGSRYCPGESVKRGPMAAFLRRALDLPEADEDYFTDDEDSIFEEDINAIAEAGITNGCSEHHYCPDRPVSRGAMAAFLRRAFDLPSATSDYFTDDSTSAFETDINAIAQAEVTKGCSASADLYCPFGAVSRGQMASFLARALDLTLEAGSPTTSLAVPVEADQTLTGDIEGAYTGTVELEGNVNLTGHVTIANGGVLVARPGVHVEGNGYALDFANGASADIQGTPTPTWSDDGAVQNLERDITFNDMKRIMFHHEAGKSTLRYFSIKNSGSSELGDYPLHFHLNGNSTRGTLVEGVVVVNGKHHAFVPHGSHGITFRDTIAKNTEGAAYWWDPPGTNEDCSFQDECTVDNSNDIVYDHALADGVTNGPGEERGFTLTGFELGAGSGNVVQNSASINIRPSHIDNCSGFKWPSDANQNEGGNVWIFEDNFSVNPSGCHGIFVWQNDGGHHVIDGFTGDGIHHGAYSNRYEYRNIDVPYMEVHAAGFEVTSGRIGKVVTLEHRSDTTPTAEFRDVTIDRFVIHNDGGDVAGHYILQNTGLSCDDIEYSSVVDGTEIVVDGEEC